MRYFIAMMGGLTIGFLAHPARGQVAPMAGMANQSVAAANMNVGANVASVGGHANFAAVQSGVGGGYGSTGAASLVGSNLGATGSYPVAAIGPRYFGQNSGTVAGMYGTGAAIANQAGQPFAFNRYRSMFTSGAVTNNPSVQAHFGRLNGQGYFGQGNSLGYFLPGYGAAGTIMEGGPASRFSNGNLPGSVGFYGPLNNGLPVYTFGQASPAVRNLPNVWSGYAPYSAYGVSSGYAPYSAYSNSAAPYPTTNGLVPGSY